MRVPPPSSSKGNRLAKIVCAAFIERDQVLLVRRAPHRKWGADLWDLVGGHVDKGEAVDVALVRECQEEVGLTPLAFNHLATVFQNDDNKQKSPFHIYAIPTWTGGSPKLLGTEHSELAWFNSEDLSKVDLALEGYRAVVLRLLKSGAD